MKLFVLVVLLFYMAIVLLPHYWTKDITNTVQPIKRICNVPLVIYRTHSSLTIPDIMYNFCVEKWIKLNPKHNMLWLNNKQCDQFMKTMGKRIYKCYKKIKPGAYKADLWRACILYKLGGIYVDSYTTPFCSLALMLNGCWNKSSQHQFISVKERDKWGIHNGFIVCTASHPFIRQYIADMVHNIEKKYYGETDLDITGPKCLINSINKVLGENKDEYEEGWNNYGELSFYLFKLETGIYKPIYKKGKLIMNKKYSFLHFIKQKWVHSSSTYCKMWKEKRVYKIKN